jgi:nicotinic acid mononucleotide adenylyltransferase
LFSFNAQDPKRQVVGGYLCPTHHKYGKASLAPMHHRINMVGLAVESSPWIDVDMWECAQEGWTPTALSLARLAKEVSKIPIAVGNAPPAAGVIKVMMVCGADLLGTFMDMKADGEPLWLPEHREIILGQNGIACLRREGTDLDEVRDARVGGDGCGDAPSRLCTAERCLIASPLAFIALQSSLKRPICFVSTATILSLSMLRQPTWSALPSCAGS